MSRDEAPRTSQVAESLSVRSTIPNTTFTLCSFDLIICLIDRGVGLGLSPGIEIDNDSHKNSSGAASANQLGNLSSQAGIRVVALRVHLGFCRRLGLPRSDRLSLRVLLSCSTGPAASAHVSDELSG
jgi:hypothetical protein